MGFEGKNLRIIGSAFYKQPNADGEAAVVNADDEVDPDAEDENATKLNFTAPVENFRLTGEFTTEDNPDIVKYNKNSKKP